MPMFSPPYPEVCPGAVGGYWSKGRRFLKIIVEFDIYKYLGRSCFREVRIEAGRNKTKIPFL